jgi:small subunit ribosomal protein S5
MKVMGHSGSVRVTLKPAPRGVGLALGEIAKSVLRLAGIRDAWGFTQGHTKTTVNYALATFGAIQKTARMKATPDQVERLKIHAGAEKVYVRGVSPPPPPREESPRRGRRRR